MLICALDHRYERVLEIKGSNDGNGEDEPRFSMVRIHPRFPEKKACLVAVNDGRIVLLDLEKSLRDAKGMEKTESWLMGEGGIVVSQSRSAVS